MTGESITLTASPVARTHWGGLESLINPQPWVADALCAQTDPEIFHPAQGGSSREAKAVCKRCTVTEECLAYALATGQPDSIWGGLSPRQRLKIRMGARA